jgi:hypothetical protein
MPSISVSQHVWERLQRESQRRGLPVNAVLAELLGAPATTDATTTPKRTSLKTLREAIVVALRQLGGRATNTEVLAHLSTMLDLTPADHEANQQGKPRWKVQAVQAASQLRRDGVLRVARHGVWALATPPSSGLGRSASHTMPVE